MERMEDKKKNYGWDFPPNAGGGISECFNNAGIESFKGRYWDSLARETIQNSIDARGKNAEGPVIVKFERIDISSDKIPGKDELLEILKACRDYRKTPEKAKEAFERGIEVLSKPFVQMLKISDYNTTGLRGVFSDENSDWHNLVKSSGNSNKESGAGGSFGIGKNAPFACSLLRTVFYATKNEDGETAFQGVAQLASHDRGAGETRGTGFYRDKVTYDPITDFSDVDEVFRRDEIGTDVFVVGLIDAENWKERIIKAVIENFFVALHEEQLVVYVDDTLIDRESLPQLIDKYIKEDKDYMSDQYYEAICNGIPIEFNIDDFGEDGKVQLFVKEDRRFKRKVAMVRSTGMKITHLDRFRGGIFFAGVMIAKGKRLNEFLRQLEPPTHDRWEPSRYEKNEKYAKRILDNLKRRIREEIMKLSKTDEAEVSNIEGMGDFLPDPTIESNPFEEIGNDEYLENANEIPKEAEVKKDKKPEKDKPPKITVNGGGRRKENNSSSNGKRRGNSGTETKRRSRNTGPGKDKSILSEAVSISRIRAFCVNPDKGTYQISIWPDSDGTGVVQVMVVGEDNKLFAEPLEKAISKEKNQPLPITEKSKIGPITFKKGKKETILATFKEPFRWALEVKVNEN